MNTPVNHYNNPIPRREYPLVIDRRDFGELHERLTSELQPPNALAHQLVRQLAMELLKLQFAQRVEFALIDQVQEVDERQLGYMKEARDMRAKGKSAVQCEHELAVLASARQAVEGGKPPRVAEEDIVWLAPAIFGRIAMWERGLARKRELISEIEAELRTTTDEEGRQHLLKERREGEADAKEDQLLNEAAGRVAHGIETEQHVARILSGSSPIPEGTSPRWCETLSGQMARVSEQREYIVRYDRSMDLLRTQALLVAAGQLPKLGPVQEHSAKAWKNIERCVKQLHMMGVDLKAAGASRLVDGVEVRDERR